MKYSVLILVSVLLFSCSDRFLNHSLTYEKLGNCTGIEDPVQLDANINGERFTFHSCLDADFNEKDYTIQRTGDSILVSFTKTSTKPQALFNITLDIDAKPRYHHIILDGKDITLTSSDR